MDKRIRWIWRTLQLENRKWEEDSMDYSVNGVQIEVVEKKNDNRVLNAYVAGVRKGLKETPAAEKEDEE